MKSLNTLLVANSVLAVALATGGLAGTAIAATPAPIVVNLPGTPDDGQTCRSGYTASFTGGTTFKCSKSQVFTVVLECTNPLFPTYVIRAPNGPASDGKDLCTKAGVVITSTGPLGGLQEGKDYVKAEVNPATITDRTSNKDHQEAVALGLTDSDVDTLAGATVIFVDRGVGSKDNADPPLTHFTFGVATGGFVPSSLRATR